MATTITSPLAARAAPGYMSLLPVTYPPPCIQNITGFLFFGSTPPGTEISRDKQSSVPIAAPVKCSKRMREMSTKFIEAQAYTYYIRCVLYIKPNLVRESDEHIRLCNTFASMITELFTSVFIILERYGNAEPKSVVLFKAIQIMKKQKVPSFVQHYTKV